MKNTVLIIQIVISVVLSGLILLQAKGTGLGAVFGGSSQQYRSRRGVEKLLYQATIILIILFFVSSIVNLFYQ